MTDLEKDIKEQLKKLETNWNKGQQIFAQLTQQVIKVKEGLITIKGQYEVLSKLVKKPVDKLKKEKTA